MAVTALLLRTVFQSSCMLTTVQPRVGERLDQLAAALRMGVVGVFACRVGVMDDQAEARAGIVDGRVFEHGLVAVAIADGHHGAAAGEPVDAGGLAFLVIDEDRDDGVVVGFMPE